MMEVEGINIMGTKRFMSLGLVVAALSIVMTSINTVSADSTSSFIPSKNAQSSITGFASGVTVNEKSIPLYDVNGKQFPRLLGEGTSWRVDIQNTVDGNIYYRVGNNEFVKGEQVVLYKNDSGNIKISTKAPADLYNRSGVRISRSLAPNTVWHTDRFITINGISYVRVATNEYVQTGDFVAVD